MQRDLIISPGNPMSSIATLFELAYLSAKEVLVDVEHLPACLPHSRQKR